MNKAVAGLDPATVTAMLRAGALAIKPQEIGLRTEDCPQVWGLMMELGYANVVASLVVLFDGSVSVYLSDGGGVIGCGLHPEVRSAASKLLCSAQRLASACRPASTFPMPADAQVCFYLLTVSGVVSMKLAKEVLDDGAVEFSEPYYAGLALIDIIELLGAGVDLVDEMRLTQSKLMQRAASNTEVSASPGVDAVGEPKARGRACRILPYVGSAARRLHN